MERILSPAAFAFAALMMMLMLLAMSVVTPQNAYYRWQELNSGTTRKADWIYERLHFDAEPIDIALIGTSRMGGGLSGPSIEAAYCAATGRRIRVANLSIPETGRNMHYVIAKEAMRTKAPALTVIELNETEARRQHRGFVMLADVADVVSAPILTNINYFPDLARLPGRQATVYFNTLAGRGAVRPTFDPAVYPGRDLDRTREIPLLDGGVISRFVTAPKDELDAAHARRRGKYSGVLRLPASLRRLEYATPRHYLAKIKAVAEQRGGVIEYAFIPAWREPSMSAELLEELGVNQRIIDLGGMIASDPDKWMDATHVNAWGAAQLSSRFAEEIAARRPTLGEIGCATP